MFLLEIFFRKVFLRESSIKCFSKKKTFLIETLSDTLLQKYGIFFYKKELFYIYKSYFLNKILVRTYFINLY